MISNEASLGGYMVDTVEGNFICCSCAEIYTDKVPIYFSDGCSNQKCSQCDKEIAVR